MILKESVAYYINNGSSVYCAMIISVYSVNEVIAKYIDTSAINLNKLIDGSSVNRPNASNAIAIQDLVRRLNGSGLKVT